jgi:hypothetical protein
MTRLVIAALLVTVSAAGSATTGPEVNVSNLPGAQSEATIAIQPTDGKVLLAGSNSFSEGTMRAYGSIDGGATWKAATVFPSGDPDDTCAADPSVGIDRSGRQYYAFIRATPCATGHPRLYVATRPGPEAAWRAPHLVSPLGKAAFDDKPALTVDRSAASPHRNRAYVAWSRVSYDDVSRIVLSSSDDGGRTWTKPVRVDRTGEHVTYATLATSRRGTLYVAWHDVGALHVHVALSTDGGRTFGAEREVVAFAIVPIPGCNAGIVIPAQRLTCMRPNPTLAVDTSRGPYSGRVYVSYAHTDFQGDKGVAVTVLDARLRPLAGYPVDHKPLLVSPPSRAKPADQFLPASAVDPDTGTVWVCFYDTKGDPNRKRAWFSCTSSATGGMTWSPAIRVARAPSDETQPEADSREYGHYQGLVAAHGVAHPVWTDGRNPGAAHAEEIYTTVVRR